MSQSLPHLHAILLCEDYGARLWPLAREQAPSCFSPIEPGSSETLLSATVERVAPLTDQILHIVTTQRLAPLMSDELLARVGLASDSFELLIEPANRGTAFAIALAAAHIRRKDPSAVIAVFPTDQRVELDDRWTQTLYRAYQVALRDRIAIIGSQQEEKAAGDSYIRKGRQFENIEGSFEVKLFSADAPAAVARRAHLEGAFWYTGIMVARAATILGELSRAGDLNQTADTQSSHRIAETANFLAMLDAENWLHEDAKEVVDTLPFVSYDKAALETSESLVAIPVTIPFSRIAALDDLDSLVEPDKAGNRFLGEGVVVDSRNTTVFAQGPGRTVATLGLRDMLIVDTSDALLVADKTHLRDMGNVLVALRETNDSRLAGSDHRPFPWGSAVLLHKDAFSVILHLELIAGGTIDFPDMYAAFDLSVGVCTGGQCVVTHGTVTCSSSAEESRLIRQGKAFAVLGDERSSITCHAEAPAALTLTLLVDTES